MRAPGTWAIVTDVCLVRCTVSVELKSPAQVLLDYTEATDPDVVYVETLAGDIYLEEGSDVERYTIAFDRLRAAALHPDESVQVIERLARTLSISQGVRAQGVIRSVSRGQPGGRPETSTEVLDGPIRPTPGAAADRLPG